MTTVTVRATTPAGQVAFWDRNPRYPEGEIYLVSGDVATVELTTAVSAALGRGFLTLVEPAATAPASPEIVEPAVKPAKRGR